MQTPPVVDPVRADSDLLRSLAIGFKIMGWIHGIGACVGLGFLLASAVTTASGFLSPQSDFGASLGGGVLLALIGILAAFVPVLYLVTSLKTARFLEERRRWGYCFGTSILWLLVQPAGLVLGIIAIVLLHRPSIRQSFTS
ncbi:MAG TPA: hypothetical protein VK171_14685 [Fimbriimonas sp.]|nr:hypothetical protein [Fimbriimonas sp.]